MKTRWHLPVASQFSLLWTNWPYCDIHIQLLYNLCSSSGERLRNTYVISHKAVTCLVVPRLMFWRHGHMSILFKMRDDLEASVPPEGDLSRLYWEAAQWERYKQDITTEVRQRKRIPIPTKLEDVPQSIRDDSGEFINLALTAERERRRNSLVCGDSTLLVSSGVKSEMCRLWDQYLCCKNAPDLSV